MAYTYVLTTDRGKVRFLTGDTNALDILLQDDELDYLLTTYTTVLRSAIEACRAIAAKLSRESDKRIGDLSLSMSQRATAYLVLAKTLQASSSLVMSGYAGGISISDKQFNDTDSDRIEPIFKRDTMSSESLAED